MVLHRCGLMTIGKMRVSGGASVNGSMVVKAMRIAGGKVSIKPMAVNGSLAISSLGRDVVCASSNYASVVVPSMKAKQSALYAKKCSLMSVDVGKTYRAYLVKFFLI